MYGPCMHGLKSVDNIMTSLCVHAHSTKLMKIINMQGSIGKLTNVLHLKL